MFWLAVVKLPCFFTDEKQVSQPSPPPQRIISTHFPPPIDGFTLQMFDHEPVASVNLI